MLQHAEHAVNVSKIHDVCGCINYYELNNLDVLPVLCSEHGVFEDISVVSLVITLTFSTSLVVTVIFSSVNPSPCRSSKVLLLQHMQAMCAWLAVTFRERENCYPVGTLA